MELETSRERVSQLRSPPVLQTTAPYKGDDGLECDPFHSTWKTVLSHEVQDVARLCQEPEISIPGSVAKLPNGLLSAPKPTSEAGGVGAPPASEKIEPGICGSHL